MNNTVKMTTNVQIITIPVQVARRAATGILVLLCTSMSPLWAQELPTGTKDTAGITQGMNETAIVQIPIPEGLTADRIRTLFVKSAPKYQHVDGLLRKYFILSGDKAGGVYLFKTRRQAEAYFSPAWHAGIRQAYGADTQVLMYETPVIVDNIMLEKKAASRRTK